MKLTFVVLILLTLAACARPPQPVWTDLPSSDQLLQRLAETTGQIESLDGVASVGLNVKEKFFSSQQFLLLGKPDRIRADVLTGFGQLILQLTSDGKELAVFSKTSVPGRFYRGPATADNLSRFTRIPLAVKDMVRLLLYDPPLIEYQQSEVTVEDGDLLLRLKNSQLQQELLFNPQLLLVGCRYFSEGKVLLEVLYQKLDEQKVFPRMIRLDVVAENTQASIKFSELQVNIETPPERFRLQAPANIPVEILP